MNGKIFGRIIWMNNHRNQLHNLFHHQKINDRGEQNFKKMNAINLNSFDLIDKAELEIEKISQTDFPFKNTRYFQIGAALILVMAHQSKPGIYPEDPGYSSKPAKIGGGF